MEGDFLNDRVCPVCGKHFTVLWPRQWAYRGGTLNNPKFYCSWKCLRANEKRKGENRMGLVKVTEAQKARAVEIAIEGGNPLKYLEECGSENAASLWSTIKKKLKEEDPDTYYHLPEKYLPKVKKAPEEQKTVQDCIEDAGKAADDFFGACIDAGLKFDGANINQLGDYEISAVRIGRLGEFYHDHEHNCVDWRTPAGDEVSLGLSGWKELLERLPMILKILGVN